MTDEKEKPKDELRCSYCGKPRSEVSKLIVGPSVYICDQCIWLFVHVLAEEHMADQIRTMEIELKAANEKPAELEKRLESAEELTRAIIDYEEDEDYPSAYCMKRSCEDLLVILKGEEV